jgi:hypothetical protein
MWEVGATYVEHGRVGICSLFRTLVSFGKAMSLIDKGHSATDGTLKKQDHVHICKTFYDDASSL